MGPAAILRIDPDEVYALAETQIHFTAAGFDQHYNPVTVEEDSLVWSCDAALGAIDETGLFTAGSEEISGYVYVAYDAVSDSAPVHITDIASIDLQPNPIILEVGEEQQIVPQARDAYGNVIELTATDYQWSATGEMGDISPGGLFTATQPGEGYIIATYRSVAGSTAVLVGIPTEAIIDDFGDLSNWNLTGVRVNLGECSITLDSSVVISAPASGRLHYSLQTGGTSALYLNCSILISGTPDAIGLHLYGDGRGHWLRGEFEDADQEKFLVNFTSASPGIDWSNSWHYLDVPLDEAEPHWGNPAAVLSYPITWKKIYLAETDDAAKDSGTVFLDDFTASFITTGIEKDQYPHLPTRFELKQNYPNPFNPTTRITFQLPQPIHVTLEVYNVLGQCVATLVKEEMSSGNHVVSFDAAELASGIYLCQMKAGSFQQTKKMAFIK
jgi:hypothetical protein